MILSRIALLVILNDACLLMMLAVFVFPMVFLVVTMVELAVASLEHGDVLGVLSLGAREAEWDEDPEEDVGNPV